ncbi:MAG: DUF4388 domain-containing protein [Geobacteraceae bacterium]|nr:DUF4388 domain-containing protein [Geobacteraceae bacterium]
MSFTGDLEHLPIVDVIQLIYTTRKSGTLSIISQKGESQLVFSDGYFASANHLNNSVRIGQILIENKVISVESLEQALLEQKNAGTARKPLIATLIEDGSIKSEDAYKGLETLIEMTIVEVLTWTNGTFVMDVNRTELCDEYRYFPETLKQEMLMNAQSILMDALRIYDEKMRDGTLEHIFFASGENDPGGTPADMNGNQPITADLLGLDALDTLTKKIPDVFIGLKDSDCSEEHRRIISEQLGSLPPHGQDLLCSFLTQLSSKTAPPEAGTTPGALPLAIIVFSSDPFIKHAITTICRWKNYLVFTTDDDSSLDLIIEQSFSRDLLPLLIMDDPAFIGAGYTEETLAALLQQKRDRYPRISILQMSSSPDVKTFPPHVLDEGTEAIFPRPVLGECADSFVSHMTGFLKSFSSVLDKSFTQTDRQASRKLKECIEVLSRLTEPPEVARELLKFASGLFERSIILVAGATELTAEKGIGVTADKGAGPTGPLMFKIPLLQGSLCRDVIEKRRLYYGLCSDTTLKTHLYSAIPAPRNSKIMILPLVLSGNAIALIYADFGQAAPAPVQTEHLEILARYSGILLDYSFYRKKFERLTQAR